MTAILGFFVQAFKELLGLESCLRAYSMSLTYFLLTGQVLELVTWSPLLQLLQKDLLLQLAAVWLSPRQFAQSFGPEHFLLQSLDLQLEQMFIEMLWCITLSAERIVP